MGWFSQAVRAANVASSQNFGDKAQRLAGSLAKHYSTTSTDQQTLQYIVLFIERAEKKYPKTLYGNLLNALIYAYDSQQTKYPAHFYIDKAMEFLDNLNSKVTVQKNQSTTINKNHNPQWFKQKSEEVENHLKHIALMKLQLTKNLKDLQSQNGGHLWIDTDFIEPATETLQASLTQIQDLENRLQVLKLTYQDHL
ncbi:hypothetical protein [Acinetobacter towneri]|uniref:hypothetical protein n=1 Tax=Acinetobacter towneri TaxID=202956 RepID=UPI002B263940|nr:hypothetical protein [Acinetobacter towneri]WPC33065.1 hypothetical protein O4J62_05565 [Acinetobacter towneri]